MVTGDAGIRRHDIAVYILEDVQTSIRMQVTEYIAGHYYSVYVNVFLHIFYKLRIINQSKGKMIQAYLDWRD